MKKLILALFIASNLMFAKVNKPYPQHITYSIGVIKPTNYSQKKMDKDVASFYKY